MRWQAASSSWLMVVSTVVITTLGTYCALRGRTSMAGEGLVAELAAHDGGVLFGVRRVQADGHGVHDAFELRRDVASANQAALAVRIHAHRQLPAALHLGGHAFEQVERARGFA